MAKPDLNPRPGTGEAERPRPRTLAEARARLQDAPPGQKMKQAGGVKRRLEFSALDAKATPFGAYDAAFVNAVSDRWYALLEDKRYDGYQRGKVVLQFALNSDGRITDMNVLEATVGLDLSLICEMAVLDPAPYAPWPSDLRRLVEGNQRKVQFTFYYN
jgi:outer membrane biosynthesis protein TonB